MRRKSVLLKLFRTIFITIIGIALVMVIATYTYYKDILEKEIIQTNQSVLQQKTDEVAKVVYEAVELTESIAFNHRIIETLKVNEENDILEENRYLLAETMQGIMDEFIWSNTRETQLYNAYVIDLSGQSYNSSYSDEEKVENIVDKTVLMDFMNGSQQQVLFDIHKNINSKGIYRYSFQILHKITDHITGKLYGCVLLNISENRHWGSVSAATDWDFHDPEVQRAVEIFSRHANFEDFESTSIYTKNVKKFNHRSAQDAFAKGYQLGVTAGSDSHQMEHGIEGGIVAAFVPKLTRENVFDAIYDRFIYGTTGARILMSTKVEDAHMGQGVVVAEGKPVSVQISVLGMKEMKVQLIKNNKVIAEYEGSHEIDTTYVDNDRSKEDFYYIRVTQVDEHMAWSSPIWVTSKIIDLEEIVR